MKILYLSTARLPDVWAHGLQIFKMCDGFAQAGAEVTLVAPRRLYTIKKDPFEYYGVKKSFTLLKLPCIDLFPSTGNKFLVYVRNLSFLLSIRLLVRFGNYDAVYIREHFFVSFLPKTHLILELHEVHKSKSFVKSLKPLHYIVAITQGIKNDLEQYGISADKVLVAPDAVDLEAFEHPQSQELARTRLGLPQDKQLALYIGRLDAWKGVGTFFEAAALLPEICCAVIGGEASEITEYQKKYQHVTFLGSRPFTELANNQAAADVLILPNTGTNALSAKYTSPLKLFTYMTSGKPIVASDIPSIREILDETTAVLVKSDSPEALAEGIKKVLNDPSLAQQLAKAASEKVQNYTWQNRAKNILEFLK